MSWFGVDNVLQNDEMTNLSDFPSPDEEIKNASRSYRKPHFPENRRTTVATRRASQTNKIQRSMAESLLTQALRIFLADTVMRFPGTSSTKGHFADLFALVQSSSRLRALPPALESVALASFANRFHHREAQILAMCRYNASVRALRDIDLSSESNVFSLIACILLLGMYEITNANMKSHCNWLQHLRGLIAVIQIFVRRNRLPGFGIPLLVLECETSPNFYQAAEINFAVDPPSTIVVQPAMRRFCHLGSILSKVQSLFRRSAVMLEPGSVRYESTLRGYRDEAVSLKSELLTWSSTQPETIQYKTTHRFVQPYTLRFPQTEDLVCSILRADTYCDYFVASMWNTYRQCQLHLNNLLLRIDHLLSKMPEAYIESREYAKLLSEIQALIDDVHASIPFMLIGEGINGNKPVGSIWQQARPPMLVGGLSLQWILFTVSILETVQTSVRQEMKDTLSWIGRNLGIGQATVLAHMDRNLPGGITAKGNALTWAGFLI